mgnify:CR=1 FL=1
MSKLNKSFYCSNNILDIAQSLLGKILYTNFSNKLTGGMIVEVEAYLGATDKACHSYNNKRTKRTEAMFESGGISYVYLCYGMHYLFNIVTNHANIPHSVLIRSAIVKSGLSAIQTRRNPNISNTKLLNGPGNFAKGMGITMDFNGIYLNSNNIWIENTFSNGLSIESNLRVGIDFAGPDALLPWRYILKQ